MKAWIAVPSFMFDIPNPGTIDGHVKEAIETMQASGFTGDNLFLAAHSLGGVMAQWYNA